MGDILCVTYKSYPRQLLILRNRTGHIAQKDCHDIYNLEIWVLWPVSIHAQVSLTVHLSNMENVFWDTGDKSPSPVAVQGHVLEHIN